MFTTERLLTCVKHVMCLSSPATVAEVYPHSIQLVKDSSLYLVKSFLLECKCKCNDCNTQFSEKWNLMTHRVNNHEITEVCQHFLKENCKFNPPKKCWLLHQKPTNAQNKKDHIECYVCK